MRQNHLSLFLVLLLSANVTFAQTVQQDTAAKTAQTLVDGIPTITYEQEDDTGENGEGTIILNGERIDTNKLAPGANKAKSARVSTLNDNAENLNSVKTGYDTERTTDPVDNDYAGDAESSFDNSSRKVLQQKRDLEADEAFFQPAITALNEARAGKLGGTDFGGCSTTSTSTTVPSGAYTLEEQVCEITNNPGGTNSQICTRVFERANVMGTLDQEKSGLLGVSNEVNAAICSRNVTATGEPIYLDQSFNQALLFPSLSSGDVCSTTRTTTSSSTWVAKEKIGFVTINTETNGYLCKRDRWAETVQTGIPGTQTANLDIFMTSSARMCSITRWPTSTTTTLQKVKPAVLGVNTELNNTVLGQRWHTPTSAPQVTPQAINSSLSVNKESNLNICTRTVTPVATIVNVAGAKSSTLAIDTQVDGVNICKRVITPVSGTVTQAVSISKYLAVNKELSAIEGTRTRWPTSGSVIVNGTQAGQLDVNTEVNNALQGSKWHWPTSAAAITSQAMNSVLSTNKESNQLFCKRTITPTASTINVPSTKAALLDIDTQVDGVNICTRTITPASGSSSQGISFAATLNVNKESPSVLGDRTRWPTATTINTPTSDSGLLNVNVDVNNLVVGSKWHWATANSGTVNQSYNTSLNINTDSSGVVATKSIWPSTVLTPTGGTHSGSLSIDTQAPGNICKRTVWPTAGSGSVAGSHSGLLDVNTETVGNVATRTRWPTQTGGTTPGTQSGAVNLPQGQSGDTGTIFRWVVNSGASVWNPATTGTVVSNDTIQGGSTTTSANFRLTVPDGTLTVSGLTITPWTVRYFGPGLQNDAGAATGSAVITSMPTLANGWSGTAQFTSPPAVGGVDFKWYAMSGNLSWTNDGFTGPSGSRVYTVQTTSTPLQAGPTCSSISNLCTKSAPTVINSLYVTAADVSGLALLYSGATNTCVSAKTRQTCTTATVNTTLNILSSLPSASSIITNFNFTVSSPVPGGSVALIQTPSQANGWNAIFATTRTSFGSAATATKAITMTWDVDTTITTLAVNDTGLPNDLGSPFCPASWNCTQSAPTTLNGVAVTAAMVTGLPALYPSASTTCVTASKDRVCSGSAVTNSSISIASQIAVGATGITGFNWSVSNPQSGIAVALVSAPSLANSWVASFSVTRSNWVGVPSQPNIAMTWNATVPSVTTAVQDSGPCATAGSTNCPATWSCESSAPFTVNGISVTPALAALQAPLYPSASSSCVVASNDKVCSGTANTSSTISVLSKIAAGVTSISGFNFTVTNPQAGVVVSIVAEPAQANGWVATFNVARSNWSGGLVAPNINMSWTMGVPSVVLSVNSTGDENDAGTISCPASWACTSSAPQTINGVAVSAGMAGSLAPLYPGASNSACTNATKSKVCSGGAVLTTVDISGQIAANTLTISGFSLTIGNPQAGVTATVITEPALSNGWNAVIQVSRSNWTYVPVQPQITLNWTANTTAVAITQQSSGNTSSTGTISCPSSWSCTASAPATINGVAVTAAQIQAQPLLYLGASNTCITAELKQTCAGSSSVTTVLDVSSKIQPGVTAISNFAFTVSNPQAGVTVALTSAPSLANSWKATFSVSRSVWATVPAKPSIAMTWDSAVPTITYSLQDTGVLTGTNTANCPVGWACKTSAPATINGIPLTAAMVSSEALLFPGASPSCLVGEFKRTCAGSHTTQTTVDISSQLPVGTTNINSFAFTVSNPQAGVTISLSSAPNASNSWIATFNVVRSVWGAIPVDPQITISFLADVGTTSLTVVDAGNCLGSGSGPQCPATWTCSTTAPTTIVGLPVDAVMAASKAPLYSGAANNCVVASRNAQCSGTANTNTTVDISGDLPANTQSISGFGFTVSNPQAGVVVSLVTAPSAVNLWVATFKVARSNWAAGLSKPNISVTWSNVVGTITTAVVDSSLCAGTGTVSCPTAWVCTDTAPVDVGGVTVSTALAANHFPLFPGAQNNCAIGEFRKICGGGGSLDSNISIASTLPANTNSISGFTWVVVNPQTGVNVALLSAPTSANSWVASYRVTRTNWNVTPVDTQISMSWNADHTVTDYTQESSGVITDSGSLNCPSQWSCSLSAPSTVNGVMVSAAVANTLPKLYTGAAGTCLKGDLKRVCSGVSNTSTVLNIAGSISGGVTAISNFTFVVANPQSGITVSLVTAPSLSNGWNATFNVARSAWVSVPSKPNITMNWDEGVPVVTYSLVETGAFTGTSTTNCPVAWSCKTSAPALLNGINVTAAMVAGEPLLFAGASASCLVGEYKRVCSGNHTSSTTINISTDLPVGTIAISGFSFVVTNPQVGVNVSLLTAPSSLNGWNAVFNVVRSNWASAPADPNITINFFADVGSVSVSVVDAGDCTSLGSAQCAATWTCPIVAPATINGLPVDTVTANSKAPLYTGAPNNCVSASRDTKCVGSAYTNTTVDISADLPANTTSITAFAFTVSNPQSGVVVSLLASPNVGNGWVATFRTARSNWATGLVAPNINLTWNNVVSTVTTSVVDSSACTDQPTPTCPTNWTCTGNAPKTIDGISVTTAMAATHSPLFPSANATCVTADFKRVCSGTGAMDTAISIGGNLPANTNSVLNFTWTLVNPQVGVSVVLLSAPTALNSWTANFRVTRTNWNVEPVDPQLTLSWDADHTVTSFVQDVSGDVNSTGSVSCPAVWSCDLSAPAVVNGVGVSTAMAQALPLLYAGASNTCLRAKLTSACTGSADVLTDVSIADVVGSVSSISSFTYTVTNIQPGVSIQLLTTPTLANSWVASFRVRRTNWSVVPEAPALDLKWSQAETTVSYALQTNGTCTESTGPVCNSAWSCRTNAPATLNGVAVTAAMVAAEPLLYPGAATSCLVGDLDLTCAGTQTTETNVSIAGNILGGTTAINNFAFTISNPQSGVAIAVTTLPSLANGWVATFGVTRTNWLLPVVAPNIVMTWNRLEDNVVFSVQDQNDCSATGSVSCPAVWTCDTNAPVTINGLAITDAMLTGQTALYSGGSVGCTSATLNRTCPPVLNTTVTIDVSSEIVAGVTTIRNVAFSVLNPQTGIDITLISAPSLSNSWIATFQVSRTNMTVVPANPEIKVTFEAEESTVSVGTETTCTGGSGGGMAVTQPGISFLHPLFISAISGGGGGSCLENWVCTANAPTTINGVLVTPAMLAGLPELFPGAAATCAAAKVVRTCSGTLIELTDVSIASLIPVGVTALINYQWSITNPQPGVSISQVEAPALANGWVGRYAVSRDYATATTMVAPQISLTWRVENGVNIILGKADTGTCDETPTTSCVAQWSCETSAPNVVNGFNITAALLGAQSISLFAGNTTCLKANLNRVCSGTGGVETVIDISDVVPSNATAILNFAFTVTTPISDVNVVLVTAPSFANGWKATFRTERADWSSVPAGLPAVKLTWQVGGQLIAGLIPVDVGDCSITGDEFCTAKWECTGFATSSGGGGGTPVDGEKRISVRPIDDGIPEDYSISIASLIPAGTTSLSNVVFTATNTNTTFIAMTEEPSLSNGWMASFSVYGSCFNNGNPQVMLGNKGFQAHGLRGTFCEPGTGVLKWTANVNGSGQTGGTTTGNSITEADMVGVAPIYPGAPAMCISARKVYDCSGISDGTVCSGGETGEVCDVVVGGPVNTCTALEADPTCTLASSACNEDAIGTNGFCYITEKLFKCKVGVNSSDTIVSTTQTCNTQLPLCTEAGCGTTTTDETKSQVNANKAFATMALLDAIQSDRSGPLFSGINKTSTVENIASVDKPTGSALVMGDPLPAPGSDVSGWDPWLGPENDETPVGTAAGFDPNSVKFFDGRSNNCKKVLGGLLNCCTKSTPQSGNNEWWKIFRESMSSGYAGVASCTTPNTPGGYSQMGTGTSTGNQALSAGFTSALDNLMGGGTKPACKDEKELTMANVNNQFMNYANTTQKSKLSWYCTNGEYELAVAKKLGSCSYIGSYCGTSVLGVCVDKRQRYCCFNSPMSRMLREQLQTSGVVGMGTAKNPRCGGVTFDQLKQLSMDNTDSGELEGLMYEAGAIPSINSTDYSNLLEQLTGAGSLIGNDGRTNLETRTQEYMGQVNVGDTRTVAEDQIISTIPVSAAPVTGTAGQVSFGTSQIYVRRGNAVYLQIKRSGGVGTASVSLAAQSGTAVSGSDFDLSASTVSWSDGDVSVKEVKVTTYQIMPKVTENRVFEVLLTVTAGSVTIGTSGRAIITIQPSN